MDLTGIGKLYTPEGKELAKLYDNAGHVIWQRNMIAAGTTLWGPGFSFLDATDYPRSYPMPISDIDKGINVSFGSYIKILGTAPDGVTAESTVLFLPAEYRVYQLRIQWSDRNIYSVDLKIELTSNAMVLYEPTNWQSGIKSGVIRRIFAS